LNNPGEACMQEIAGRSEDFQEGITAILEKRQPAYKGK
jgi:enoyl-CoA hydratase/carnithine racemase